MPTHHSFDGCHTGVERELDVLLASAETAAVSESFRAARQLSRAARSLLHEGRSAGERIGALRLSGRCDVVRGDLAWKAGNVAAARLILDAGYTQCREAGDGAGQGLARDRMALIASYRGHPEEAVRLARDGARTAGSGPVVARLAATEAYALAAFRTTDTEDVEAAVDHALTLAHDLPGPEQGLPPGLWFDAYSPFEAAQYASACYARRGLLAAARRTAATAGDGSRAMGAVGYQACTQLNLATALVATTGRIGIEEACDLADSALTTCARRPEAPVAEKAAAFAALARQVAPGAEPVRRISERATRWGVLAI